MPSRLPHALSKVRGELWGQGIMGTHHLILLVENRAQKMVSHLRLSGIPPVMSGAPSFIRNIESVMQTLHHLLTEPALAVQHLGNTPAGADIWLKVFLCKPLLFYSNYCRFPIAQILIFVVYQPQSKYATQEMPVLAFRHIYSEMANTTE